MSRSRTPLLAWVLAAGGVLASSCTAQPPRFQAGLWEVHGQTAENRGSKRTDFYFKLCRDRKYDKAQLALIENRKGCSTKVEKTAAQKFSSSSTCRIAGTTIVSEGATDYRTAGTVHSETKATYTPPLDGKIDEVIVQDQKFLGACPAGMRVGDLIGTDGLIRHQN